MLDHAISAFDDLREHIGEPQQRVLDKQLDHLDRHCRDFIARSPIALLATAGADGRCDCSPRGGPAGFARVLDDHRLLIPDYTGNRRQDSHANVLENPHVGLLFRSGNERDPADRRGRTLPRSSPAGGPADRGHAATAARALRRGAGGVPALRQGVPARRRLGSATWLPSDELPSAAEIYRDHRDTPGLTVAQTQAELEESIRERMW